MTTAGAIAALLLLTGVALALVALKYRTAEHPRLSLISPFNPRNWVPIWRMKSWFSPKGYWLNLIGNMIIAFTMLGAVAYSLLK